MIAVEKRTLAIGWLRRKIRAGEAGLDPFDSAVLVVEVADPDHAWRINEVGLELIHHPHIRPDGSRCLRVRCLVEPDVRGELGLDGYAPPLIGDVPFTSRHVRPPRRDRQRKR